MLTRRRLLHSLGLTSSLGLLPRGLRAAASNVSNNTERPKRLILLQLSGAPDFIYSFDPKQRSQVNKKVDVPYSSKQLVTAPTGIFGPLAAPLADYAPRMAIVRGIESGTVAHELGDLQISHLNRQFSVQTPGIGGIVGRLVAPDDPVSSILFSRAHGRVDWVPPHGKVVFVGEDGQLLKALAELKKTNRLSSKMLQDAKLSNSHFGDELHRGARWAERIDPAGLVLDRRVAPAVFKPEMKPVWPAQATARFQNMTTQMQERLDWVHYICEHSLASSMFVNFSYLMFDSHERNHKTQLLCHSLVFPLIRYLLDRLSMTRRPDGKSLLDESAVIIAAEFGRFPVMNNYEGKDHFPEFCAAILGPGIKPGFYGETDEWMIGKEVSLDSGAPSGTNRKKLTVDDLGASVLKWFGCDQPLDYGYSGANLPFLWQ